jgi:hypothetical protein
VCRIKEATCVSRPSCLLSGCEQDCLPTRASRLAGSPAAGHGSWSSCVPTWADRCSLDGQGRSIYAGRSAWGSRERMPGTTPQGLRVCRIVAIISARPSSRMPALKNAGWLLFTLYKQELCAVKTKRQRPCSGPQDWPRTVGQCRAPAWEETTRMNGRKTLMSGVTQESVEM